MSTTPASVCVAGALALALAFGATPPRAGEAWTSPLAPRQNWSVTATAHDFDTLLGRLREAVAAEGMIVVTEAGPTAAARSRGIDIPGNRVVGVFRNDLAVRILALSVAAMIEAPIRFYVTENPDGTATLSYRQPSAILAPYLDEGGNELAGIAAEIGTIFATISARATE